MKLHIVRVRPSSARLAKTEQLAWKFAEVTADPVAVDDAVAAMISNLDFS